MRSEGGFRVKRDLSTIALAKVEVKSRRWRDETERLNPKGTYLLRSTALNFHPHLGLSRRSLGVGGSSPLIPLR